MALEVISQVSTGQVTTVVTTQEEGTGEGGGVTLTV